METGAWWCVIRELRLWRGDGGSGIGREMRALTAGIAGEIQKALGLEDAGGLRLRMNFSRVLRSNAPTATLLVRLMVGWVFLSEGIQKFLFPAALGVGRFIKIGIPAPHSLRPSLELWKLFAAHF